MVILKINERLGYPNIRLRIQGGKISPFGLPPENGGQISECFLNEFQRK
jgi:hypothetical protein